MMQRAPACKCARCSHGCKVGSGFFGDESLKPTAQFLGISEEELKAKYLEEVEMFHTKRFRPKTQAKPFGQCIFFDKIKGCTIHPVKPLECKIASGCKAHGEEAQIWFRLNYFVNPDDPQSIREYANVLKCNPKTIKGGSLKELVPDNTRRSNILSYKELI